MQLLRAALLTEIFVRDETAITQEDANQARTELMLALCSQQYGFTILKQFAFETRNGGYGKYSERFSDKDAEQLDGMPNKWDAMADLRDRDNRLAQEERNLKVLHNSNYSDHAKVLAGIFRIPNDTILLAIARHVEMRTTDARGDAVWHETIVKNREILQQTLNEKRALLKLIELDENTPQAGLKIDKGFALEDQAANDFLLKLIKPSADSTQSISISERAHSARKTVISPHTRLQQWRLAKLTLPRLEKQKNQKNTTKKSDKRPSRRLAEIVEIQDKIPELIIILRDELGIVEEAGIRELVTKSGRKINIDKEMRGDFTYSAKSHYNKKNNTLTDVSFIIMQATGRRSDEIFSHIPFTMTEKIKVYDALPAEVRRANAGLPPLMMS